MRCCSTLPVRTKNLITIYLCSFNMLKHRSIFNIGGGRNSNFELLRLVSMLMVLNLHSFWGYDHGSGILQFLDFFRESISICAVNCFLLISGFWGIRWKFKSLFNLIFQLFFYAFAVYAVVVLTRVVNYSPGGLLRNASCLYTHWGFITAYLLLYLCAPLLNAFVEKVSNKQLLGFIVIVTISECLITRQYAFLNFFNMYLIGRYISKVNLIDHPKVKPGWMYWVTTLLITILVYLSYKVLLIQSAEMMQAVFWGYSYAAPLVILQAVFLFIWFARLQFQSRFINWSAKSCLAIFLIHLHPSVKELYYGYTESLYSLTFIEHTAKLVFLFGIVFFGSILIDKIRIIISTLCYNLIVKFNPLKQETMSVISSYIPNTNKKENNI